MFYVYEHWRPDVDRCFYVGKGHGGRSYRMSGRGVHHKNVVAKLSALGMIVEVRLVASGLTEELAFELEKAQIKKRRTLGHILVNRTDGGEGPCGFRPVFSAEHRAKLSAAGRRRRLTLAEIEKVRAANIGRKHSQEVRDRMGASRLGKKRGPFSAEHRAKLSVSAQGRVMSDDARAKMSASRRGIKRGPLSDEHKAAIAATLSGKPSCWIGRKHTEESKRKMSESRRLHCAKSASV